MMIVRPRGWVLVPTTTQPAATAATRMLPLPLPASPACCPCPPPLLPLLLLAAARAPPLQPLLPEGPLQRPPEAAVATARLSPVRRHTFPPVDRAGWSCGRMPGRLCCCCCLEAVALCLEPGTST